MVQTATTGTQDDRVIPSTGSGSEFINATLADGQGRSIGNVGVIGGGELAPADGDGARQGAVGHGKGARTQFIDRAAAVDRVVNRVIIRSVHNQQPIVLKAGRVINRTGSGSVA